MGVDHGSDGIGGVVKAVDELEPQRNEQRDAEQYEWKRSGVSHHRQVIHQVIARVYDARDDHDSSEQIEKRIRLVPGERRGSRSRMDDIDSGHAFPDGKEGGAKPVAYSSAI